MNCLQKIFVLLCLFTGLMLAASGLAAQNPSGEKRLNLAVYATGLQDDNKPLSSALQTIVQNKAITKLTSNGKYQLIERSNEFLKQIQSEQNMQHSGDVADEQIAEIGAGYGAEKICVVSVTIINQYLYIATRIVDVATKTSYESGDAECEKYASKIPELTKTLEQSLDKMLGNAVAESNVSSKAQDPEIMNYKDYKKTLKKQRGAFLNTNSPAYKEYRKYHNLNVAGTFFTAIGGVLLITLLPIDDDEFWIAGLSSGLPLIAIGCTLFCIAPSHLQKSYAYYMNGDQHTASFSVHPYFDRNNTFGAGITLQF